MERNTRRETAGDLVTTRATKARTVESARNVLLPPAPAAAAATRRGEVGHTRAGLGRQRAPTPALIGPVLVAQRCAVELVPVHPPLGEMAIHQLAEVLVVAALDEMHEFVNDDVLEARARLLR
jgi:hypothetical protein